MNFLLRSLLLAVRATPYLLVSKLFHEVKWSLVGAFAGILCMLSVLVSPVFFWLLPIPIIYSQTAIALGTLHSMLTYVGMAKQFSSDHLEAEILKVTMLRGIGYLLIFLLIIALYLFVYGLDYLHAIARAPTVFLETDLARAREGQVPTIALGLGFFTALWLLLEAVLAVPMAAAAYGLGVGTRSFNGLWGLGYKWQVVFASWAIMALFYTALLLTMPGVVFDTSLFTAWMQAREGILPTESVMSAKDAGEWFSPRMLPLAIMFLLGILTTPFWAASCVISFAAKFEDDAADHKQQVQEARAQRETQKQDDRDAVRNLRQMRMPPR